MRCGLLCAACAVSDSLALLLPRRLGRGLASHALMVGACGAQDFMSGLLYLDWWVCP